MVQRFLELIIPLLFAHLLADFSFQSDQSIKNKRKTPMLIQHGVVVGLLSYLALGRPAGWIIPVGAGVSHILLDAWKLQTMRGTRLWRFLIDQGGHLLILVLVSWAAAYAPGGEVGVWELIFGAGYLIGLTVLSGAIITVYVGSFVVELSFEALGFDIKDHSSLTEEDQVQDPPASGLPGGGRVIGYLERGLILTFILGGYPAGIGFLVAAKSIFRFGELTDSSRRAQAEYIIIGTLLSILYGTAASYLTAAAIQLALP